MDRMSRLRIRSSAGAGLNSSCQSLGNGAGYETANDDSITSGSSLYYTMTEDGNETATNNIGASASMVDGEKKVAMKEDTSIDHTLENDFSVEEVSTIRKPMIMVASPATVKVASKMSCKYLGVSSTPAKALRSVGKNLSGIGKLNETDERELPSAMKKMREPKLSECSSTEEGEESSVQSVVDIAASTVAQKSFGTNVLAEFFDSLDVNKATPLPQIKVNDPEEEHVKVTPEKRRSSNSLQNFFESLKKAPNEQQGKENRPLSERKKGVRKSLIPMVAAERIKTRSSNIGIKLNENRVASPIVKPSRKSSTVKLIPDRLKEMRKIGQSDLVNVKRKSVIPSTKTVVAQVSTIPKEEQVIGDSVKVGPNRKSILPAPRVGASLKPSTSIAMKRKSVVPTAVASRKSILPVKAFRRSVVPIPPKVPLKVPAKTTLSSSDTTRRISHGKRPTTDSSIEPLAKQRKSLAPVTESKSESSPKEATKPTPRIRPPSMASIAPTAFKRPESFTCDICQRPFRLKSSLETHKKLAHQHDIASPGTSLEAGKAADTKCRYCSKTFINAKILSNHLIINCLKIPIPDKRKLLAQNDLQRASSSKSSSTPLNGHIKLPSSGSTVNSDTSASSSIGDTSSNNASGSGTTQPTSSTGAIRKKARTVGHTGITRTPKKEMKCHLCNRRFLNAVEYALHVQAHAKGVASLKGASSTDGEENEMQKDENNPNEGLLHAKDANKIVQKLVNLGRK
ncbi:uncharacterized protein LOC135713290 [Ochlerotatus camptorhynchus]|uniref:uncharacterized protein LOC135713290 n=1 Tax=Ochlerotatus camptorhynchus TaxID=644619 RepID=UPI0031D4909D